MDTSQKPTIADLFWSPERRVIVGLLVWLLLLALGSAFVSTPFVDQRAGAAPDYANTMYLHGLLIGMVGLLSLITMDVFGAGHKSRTMHNLVLWGTLGAALLSGVGGIFDQNIEDTFFLWMQIASFFFLDEILITLTIALFLRAVETRTIAVWTAAFAALSGFIAAVMGHVAGWILEFGDYPKAIVGGYAALAAESWQSLMTHLISAHAHEMVVAVIALVIATVCAAFTLGRGGNRLMRFGLWWTAIGVVAMTFIYVVAGVTWAQPPTLFAHGVSGLTGDDFVTGVGVMLGGLIALIGLAVDHLPEAAIRWGSGIVTVLMFVTVALVGYFIEAHENLYGHGVGSAPRSAADAVYGWYHQDFALFLLPAVITLLLVVKQFARDPQKRRSSAIALQTGSVVAFAGGMMYVFVSPERYGISFLVATIGIAIILVGVALSIWAVATKGSGRRGEEAPTSAD